MGGIEVLAVTVICTIGLIGLVRGPSKELGVTMALVFFLAIMSQFDTLVPLNEAPDKINDIMTSLGFGSDDIEKQKVTVWVFYSLIVILTAFLAYHGKETLAFRFGNPSGPLGMILGWIVGAINGYLIAGTVWYYLDALEYPIKLYSWFKLPLTEMGEKLVEFLPQNVAGSMVMGALALALLWWRILR